MPEETELSQPPGTPLRRSVLGSRLASRQSALGRGLDVLMGPPVGSAWQRGRAPGGAPVADDDEDATPPGGANRSALLSRLQGSHQADLTRGFRALLAAGISAPDEPDQPVQPLRPLLGAIRPGGTPPGPAPAELPERISPAAEYQIRLIRLDTIRPNPFRARAAIQQDAIARLARSIRELGILQPLVVMPAPAGPLGGTGHVIISGERRRQAALLAGLVDVPAIVREVAPGAALQLLLTEDLHSAPLRPLERARLYARLTRELRLPVTEVASRLGLTAEEIEQTLGLLSLDPDMIESIETGLIREDQAAQLVRVADEALRRRLWRNTVRHGWAPERMATALVRWAERATPPG